jgi:hypothetical protein
VSIKKEPALLVTVDKCMQDYSEEERNLLASLRNVPLKADVGSISTPAPVLIFSFTITAE